MKILPHVLRMSENMTYLNNIDALVAALAKEVEEVAMEVVEEVVVVEEAEAESLTVEKTMMVEATMMEKEEIREIFYVNGMKLLAF